MAEQDWPHAALTPERRLAARLVAEFGLTPPVAIEDVAVDYIDIDEDLLPADCDAVILGLTDTEDRPRMLVNKNRPPVRQRFTIAHELGHFFIPWHIGTIVCHTDPSELREGELLHRATESEASRFASEFLIPQRWLAEVLKDEGSVPALIGRVGEADVSVGAACFALAEFLPPGHVLAVLETASHVKYLFRSFDTDVNVPYRGERLDADSLDALAADRAEIGYRHQTIYWWFFEREAQLLDVGDDRTPTDILRQILQEVIFDQEERDFLFRSIQGISGHAKDRIERVTPERMLAELKQRFASRPKLRNVTEHSEFQAYLSRRAEQLSAPREK